MADSLADDKHIKRFWSHVQKTDGCWLWIGAKQGGGYGSFSMKGRLIGAHRASWMLFRGSIPPNLNVLHRCGNKSCVRREHLFLGTQSDNLKHWWSDQKKSPPAKTTWRTSGHRIAASADWSYRFWAKVVKGDGCWLWSGAKNNVGYGQFTVRMPKRKLLLAHRVAFALTSGEIPNGMCILHMCDAPACVRPSHLKLGTMRDNTNDMIAKGRSTFIQFTGRSLRGEENPKAKFTLRQVAGIRRRYSSGNASQNELARKYGVTQSTIWRIVNGRVYIA